MERILLLIIIILPVVFIIVFFVRGRKAEGYIEESSGKSIENKEGFIEDLKKLCSKKKWDVQFAEGKIVIRTNMTIYSMGEIITITFEEKNDGLYMKVKSKPKLKTTRIDYNKNKNNVALITGLS
jgi:hypothetical protein